MIVVAYFSQFLPWLIAAIAVLAMVFRPSLKLPRNAAARKPLPMLWALSARPVFNQDERRVYRKLRAALPHHVVLCKLPMVRFCQPDDPAEVRYWYDLLGTMQIGFCICSTSGRVLAAIDLDRRRGHSRRTTKIKQSVLDACQIRYLHCYANELPSAAELQLLVPEAVSVRAPLPASAPTLDEARVSLAGTVASRRKQRSELWHDSSLFPDSFFSREERSGVSTTSDFGSLRGRDPRAYAASAGDAPNDIVGVVVDSPRSFRRLH